MKNEIVELITQVNTGTDPDGYPIETEVKREIFAELKSVNRAEYYAAYTAGMKADVIFSIHPGEFYVLDEEGNRLVPEKLLHEGILYKIGRTYYKTQNSSMEITCERVSHG